VQWTQTEYEMMTGLVYGPKHLPINFHELPPVSPPTQRMSEGM